MESVVGLFLYAIHGTSYMFSWGIVADTSSLCQFSFQWKDDGKISNENEISYRADKINIFKVFFVRLGFTLSKIINGFPSINTFVRQYFKFFTNFEPKHFIERWSNYIDFLKYFLRDAIKLFTFCDI